MMGFDRLFVRVTLRLIYIYIYHLKLIIIRVRLEFDLNFILVIVFVDYYLMIYITNFGFISEVNYFLLCNISKNT